jgi:hypothetical protein
MSNKIFTSYVTFVSIELCLCLTSEQKLKWIEVDKIPTDIFDAFSNKGKSSVSLSSCNTDKAKVFSCEHKCKTRGILLAVFNCGILIGYRELFRKESTTQVALLYLDIYDYYIGIKLKISYFFFLRISDVFLF